MRDYASAQQEYNDLLTRFDELQRGFDILQNSVDNGAGVGAIAANVLDLQRRTEVNLSFVQTLQDLVIPDINDASQNQVEALYYATGALRDRYNDLLDSTSDLLRQAAKNDKERDLLETQPKNSAGDIVENEQDAREEDANVQSPPQGRLTMDEDDNVVPQPTNTNTNTNARKPNIENDDASNIEDATIGNQAQGGATSKVGGDKPTVKAEQTQRANNTGNVAATAANEDAYTESRTSTATTVGNDGRPAVAKEFLEPIVSKPNLLSGLSSMTYGLSLYLMSPDEFGALVASEKKILPTNQLLMQSAGANKAERNEWFNVDFYIEDFTLESIVGTQATGSPHNAVSLEFTVVEPQGITFLNRLNNAVIAHIGEQEEKTSAFAQGYLMVIRFYGYDAAGNAVTAADLGLENTTDSDAIIEKFIPFMISNFTYKISTKATEYQIKGVCQGTNVAFSTQRGEIPFNVQLNAATVDQLFNGNTVLAETQANEESGEQTQIQSGSTQTVVQGLIQALNEQQLRLAGTSYDIPDQYEVIFQDSDIKNAKIIKPGSVNKGRAVNKTAQQAAQKYLTSKINYDKESQTYNVLAGTQIAQLLDLVLRTSSYITSQQDIYIDEKTGKPVSSTDPNGQPRSVPTVQWYRIKTQVTPLGYDKKRKALANKITYIVSKYQINTPRSPYFPPAEYRGVHKLYNYWFTGQNTEVLDFEIDVNSNYYMVIGNDGRVDTRDQGKFPVQQSYSSAPGQTLQNGERGSTVPAANLSDRLYSPVDVANGEILIVGDPDWIQQSEVVYNKSLGLSPFAPDGSVNYDSSEVLFELRFNPVQDYDLATGLSNVYENNREISYQGANSKLEEANVAQESLVWAATTVTSMFKDGQFTQRLQGIYRDFNSAKNAPINPQAETVLSNGNTVEQSLAKVEQDDTEPTGAIVGGVRTNAGGTSNRAKAQTQRNNLNLGSPKTSVTTRTSQASESAAGTDNRAKAQAQRLAVQASANQSVDDDAGTETTRIVGGRSARARN